VPLWFWLWVLGLEPCRFASLPYSTVQKGGRKARRFCGANGSRGLGISARAAT